MQPKKVAILIAVAAAGIVLAHLSWSSEGLRPTPPVPGYEQSPAGALSHELEKTFRTVSYANVILHPEAVDDPVVRVRLGSFEAALHTGLRQVRGMDQGYERADKARALAGCAVGLATILWQAAFEAAAVHSSLDARQLSTWARRSNDLGGELLDAAGATLSPTHLQDLARLRRSYDNNRNNIFSIFMARPPL